MSSPGSGKTTTLTRTIEVLKECKEKEIGIMGGALNDPKRPFLAILGGSKVSSKISVNSSASTNNKYKFGGEK